MKGRLERDVALLRPESLDPDMLDERARAILNLAHQDDLIMLKRRQPVPDPAGVPNAQALKAHSGRFPARASLRSESEDGSKEPIAVTTPSLSPQAANFWLGDDRAARGPGARSSTQPRSRSCPPIA